MDSTVHTLLMGNTICTYSEERTLIVCERVFREIHK